MESIENNPKIKRKRSQTTRWNRIERKHNHSVKLPIRCHEGHGTYVNYLRNKTFFKDYHIDWLNGERRHALDPNLVMDLRHEMIDHNRRNIDIHLTMESNAKLSLEEPPSDEHGESADYEGNEDLLRNAEEIDREIEKFKVSLEHRRPAAAFDFFEYLNSHTKYKYIRAKLNRHLQRAASVNNIANNSKVIDNRYDIDSDCIGDNLADDLNGFDNVHIPSVRSNYLTRSCSELPRSCSIGDSDETSSYEDQYQSDLKIEIVPKIRHEGIELRGHAVVTLDGPQPETEASTAGEKNAIATEKPQSSSQKINDRLEPNFETLIGNMTINKITIDKPKPVSSFHCNEATDIEFDEMANEERDAIICEIFCEKKRANFVLLQKYFLKWFHYSTIERLTKEGVIGIEQTRLQKIQKFLQNITIERRIYGCNVKAKVKCANNGDKFEAAAKRRGAADDLTTLTRKYNSKLKLQQDIIGLQRTKLERQERLITELKLSKLSDNAKEAQYELKKELRQVIQMGCQPSRSKARCLQMVGNLKEPQDDDEYIKLQAKGLTMPKFLLEMQARALEREVKHQQAKERREHMEREKEEQRLVAEESKRLQDEESKRQRIEELRQKRREEKLQRIKKEQDRMAYLANIRRADEHYRFKLLRMGLIGFKRLISMKRRTEKKAQEFRLYKLRQEMLRKWKQHVDNTWRERKMKAEKFHNKQCLRSMMNLWKKFYLIEHSKRLVAEDWYDMKILERAFNMWNCLTAQSRLIMDNKMKQADAHYEWNLKWRVLDHWRRLQVILRIERETETRRQRWRQKIWELLPDYTPNTEE